MEARKVLLGLSVAKKGKWDDVYDAIKNRELYKEEELENFCSSVKSNYITMLDANYPNWLKRIYHPPFVLYYYGDISLLENEDKNLSVVGSRCFSEYGRKATEYLIKGICARYIVVSGMARGIDSIVHQTAIDNGGKTIAVLGSGIDYCYPLRNKEMYDTLKEKHLVISEYPNDVEPDPTSFPQRNRIIVAMGKALLVTEAKERSGTLISVGYALEQNKDIMCVPYRIDEDSGCNHLIANGAFLVEKPSDIIDIMEMGNAKK